MSTRTQTARSPRAENKLHIELPYETMSHRTLFSALGILMSTGVVAVAFASPDAEAKSALDEMAWAPQSQLTQSAAAADGTASGAVAIARAMTPNMALASEPAANAATYAPQQAAPVADENRVAASQPLRGFSEVLAQPRVAHVNTPQPLKGFADSGLAAPVPSVDLPVQTPVARPEAARIGVATSPMRAVSAPAAEPAVVGMRMPNVQPDLQSLRGSLATGAAANDQSGESVASGDASVAKRALSDRQDFNGQSALMADGSATVARRAQRNPRPVDQSYSEWLGDGSSSRSQPDQAVVPEQAVRAALRNAADAAAARSPAVRQARNDWEAAKYDVDQGKGQRWPQVQMGGNSPAITGDSMSFNQYNRPTGNVSISTLIYDFGKTSRTIDSRTKTAEAAEFYYRSVAQQNAFDVSSNLVELSKNRAIYAIGESYVKRMSQLVDMLVEIVKVDPGRMSELTQAQSRLLQAQTSQETVVAQIRSLQLTVQKLVGGEPTPMPGGTHWQFQLDGLDDSVAAISTNPQIEQAAAEAEAAKLNAKSVRADGLPKLNWVINKNTAPDVFGNRQPWSTMLQLSWTPFQGGSQRAAERAPLARASSSSDKRDQLELDSEYKVRDAHRDAIAFSTRSKLYADLASKTDLIRKQFFEQWYHLNRRTLVDVFSAESDFYNNQFSEVTTQFDSYRDVLKIRLNNGTLGHLLRTRGRGCGRHDGQVRPKRSHRHGRHCNGLEHPCNQQPGRCDRYERKRWRRRRCFHR
jgi:adhesin transport system outer membrane protein